MGESAHPSRRRLRAVSASERAPKRRRRATYGPQSIDTDSGDFLLVTGWTDGTVLLTLDDADGSLLPTTKLSAQEAARLACYLLAASRSKPEGDESI